MGIMRDYLSNSNQKGIGLVGALIAAAMVVTIALVVAQLVTDQNIQSKKIQLAGSCQNIANSIVEYIKKDEASLYISSYGPDPGTTRFASGLDQTEDGLDRFVFAGTQTPLFTGPTGFQMSLPNTNQVLPANWRYYNNLNIKNSLNRLLALAANEDFCCSDLNMNNANCGSVLLSDSMQRAGLAIAEKNIQVDLAVNFSNPNGSSMCSGRRLSLANLPSTNYSRPAEFKVRVTMGGAGQGKTCVAGGSVTQNLDTAPSLTLMEMQDHGALCPTGKNGLPSQCSAGSSVRFKVKTVKSSSGNSCQTSCLSQIESRTCNNLSAINLFNSFSAAACTANCIESEPGSSFLCKIGEKNWFNDPSNVNRWEPCEAAKIYDHDGSIAGQVRIQYNPVYGNTRSEVTTNATLTLSGLTSGRAYVVDVRSIDTRGNIGPSFCSSNPNSCAQASLPHFVVLPPAPVVGDIEDVTSRVGPTSMMGQLGRSNTLVSQTKYANILAPFGPANEFQCDSGAPTLRVPITYSAPAGAYGGFVTNSCTTTLRLPNGTTQNPACACTAGYCESTLPASAANGNYQFNMTITNDCGGAGENRNKNWCKDGSVTIGMTNSGNKTFGTTPDFSTHVNYPTTATKACGVVSLCPSVDGTFTPTLGPCPNSTINWNPMQHSGCIQAPSNNYCMLAVDPCGRYQETTPVSYSTTLIGVPHTATAAVNSCFQYGGTPVGGNYCATGSFCNENGKCNTSCATPPCPTNTFTAAANNCGPRYCPVLNSCTATIGNPSSSVACTTVPTPPSCHKKVLFPYVGVPGFNCDSLTVGDCMGPCTAGDPIENPYVGCANAACVCECN